MITALKLGHAAAATAEFVAGVRAVLDAITDMCFNDAGDRKSTAELIYTAFAAAEFVRAIITIVDSVADVGRIDAFEVCRTKQLI